MSVKSVLFVRESNVPEIVGEFGQDFDFEANNILMRVISDERFDSYVESRRRWEMIDSAEGVDE